MLFYLSFDGFELDDIIFHISAIGILYLVGRAYDINASCKTLLICLSIKYAVNNTFIKNWDFFALRMSLKDLNCLLFALLVSCRVVGGERESAPSQVILFKLRFSFPFCCLCRAIAPNILDKDVFGFQTLQHVLRMTRTWDSTMSLLLKGGETIWGGLDWSPEEGHECSSKKKNSNDLTAGHNRMLDLANSSRVKYGRLLSFGKDVADLHSSGIGSSDFRVTF